MTAPYGEPSAPHTHQTVLAALLLNRRRLILLRPLHFGSCLPREASNGEHDVTARKSLARCRLSGSCLCVYATRYIVSLTTLSPTPSRHRHTHSIGNMADPSIPPPQAKQAASKAPPVSKKPRKLTDRLKNLQKDEEKRKEAEQVRRALLGAMPYTYAPIIQQATGVRPSDR